MLRILVPSAALRRPLRPTLSGMKSDGVQLIHLVLTLARNGDLDTLPRLVSSERLRLAEDLASLVRSFNFVNSLAFDELTRGKSASVVEAWKRRMSEPSKQSELKEEFYDNIRRMLSGGEVERYLSPSCASQVKSIRNGLEALNAR